MRGRYRQGSRRTRVRGVDRAGRSSRPRGGPLRLSAETGTCRASTWTDSFAARPPAESNPPVVGGSNARRFGVAGDEPSDRVTPVLTRGRAPRSPNSRRSRGSLNGAAERLRYIRSSVYRLGWPFPGFRTTRPVGTRSWVPLHLRGPGRSGSSPERSRASAGHPRHWVEGRISWQRRGKRCRLEEDRAILMGENPPVPPEILLCPSNSRGPAPPGGESHGRAKEEIGGQRDGG